MDNKGFTLIELLCYIALMGLVLMLGLYMSKDTLGTSLIFLNRTEDNEVYEAARMYVISENEEFNEYGYTCVTVNELVDYGYLKDVDDDIMNKIIKIIRNNDTKVITDTRYVDKCE